MQFRTMHCIRILQTRRTQTTNERTCCHNLQFTNLWWLVNVNGSDWRWRTLVASTWLTNPINNPRHAPWNTIKTVDIRLDIWTFKTYESFKYLCFHQNRLLPVCRNNSSVHTTNALFCFASDLRTDHEDNISCHSILIVWNVERLPTCREISACNFRSHR